MIVKVAMHSGYCFGVKNAMDKALKNAFDGNRLYTYGPLIHNKQAVEMLEKKGIIEIDDLSVAHGETVIIRSHGVGKFVYDYAGEHDIKIIDATCVFVKKIHNIVEMHHLKGYDVYIIGNPTHPEVIGINGWCNNKGFIIDKDLEISFGNSNKAVVVAQTTITLEYFEKAVELLKERLPELIVFNTICSATKNRQSAAEDLSKEVDYMIVVGGKHSSNTQKLYSICKNNCKNTVHIETVEELVMTDLKKYDKIGITAGASTPEWIINEIIDKLENEGEGI